MVSGSLPFAFCLFLSPLYNARAFNDAAILAGNARAGWLSPVQTKFKHGNYEQMADAPRERASQ